MVTRTSRTLALALALSAALAASAAAPPAAPVPAPTPAQKALLQKCRRFLERLVRLAPDRKMDVELRAGTLPTGLAAVRYRLRSSDARFDQEHTLLVSEDGRWALLGRALALPPDLGDPFGPKGAQALGDLFSRQAGYPVTVVLERGPGPADATPARLTRHLPMGTVTASAALSRDGRWFLMGAFVPLDGDPRAERIRRLALADNPSLGPPEAPVTLVVVADYGCSVCAEFHPLFEGMVSKYPGRVRLVHMDVPHLQPDSWSLAAAVWARCVARVTPQAYWPLNGALFAQHQSFTPQNLVSSLRDITSALGVDLQAVASCGNGGAGHRDVLEDMGATADLDLLGTPLVLVNGALVDRGFETLLEPAVQEALKAPPAPPATP